MPIVNIILQLLALLLVISLTIFYVEYLAKIVSRQIKAKRENTGRLKTVVLRSAHNEASQIALVIK